MAVQDIINRTKDFIVEKAKQFGANEESSFIVRNNTSLEALSQGGAFFGFIQPYEEKTGSYHDFSLVIFPAAEENLSWLVCLCVGSLGFKNDYELASYPGVRRLFSKLVDENGFCKSDFSDIESILPKSFTQKLPHIKETLKTYSKVLPVCQIIDNPEDNKSKNIITAFLAAYARLRDWPSNNQHREAVSKALKPYMQQDIINDTVQIKQLLFERKYIILQGSPGTGKTRTAKKVAEEIGAKIFFTQFHAEVTYSDFIFGLRPDTNNQSLVYKEQRGIFIEALQDAIENKSEKTVLIIDEINRANLSNVLGPIFYLFEHKMEDSSIQIEVSPNFKVSRLPDNFFVIATMNTSDRSLAVVDFALRRRFAWYTLRPKSIKVESPNKFFEDDFTKFQEMFDWYATGDELNLQPGQGYFIAKDETEMKNRIRYELFPLIKEYLQEGFLQKAKEAFNHYFFDRIGLSLVE